MMTVVVQLMSKVQSLEIIQTLLVLVQYLSILYIFTFIIQKKYRTMFSTTMLNKQTNLGHRMSGEMKGD